MSGGLDTAADILRLAGSAVALGTTIAEVASSASTPARREARQVRRTARRQRIDQRRGLRARARAVRLRALAEGMPAHSKIRRSRLARAARAEVIADALVGPVREKGENIR